MSQRIIKVNAEVKRALSTILHTYYQSEAVCISITDVDVAPDLRKARVYYSVFGDNLKKREAGRFFARHKNMIKQKLAKKVTLKYHPDLEYILDRGPERGTQVTEIIDNL